MRMRMRMRMRMSERSFVDLTDVTLTNKDTSSILTDNVNGACITRQCGNESDIKLFLS